MKRFLLILFIVNCQLAIVLSQWVQQTLPVSGQTKDIIFFNVNTGLIAIDSPAQVLRTTNGGFNWNVILTSLIFHFEKIDSNTVYTHGYLPAIHKIYRSTNRGLSWDSVGAGAGSYTSISFVNKDTGWACGLTGSGTIWRTTNGGQTLVQQFVSGATFMNNIFFLKQKVNGEYIGWCSQGSILRKTTDSGFNWFTLPSFGASGYNQFYFLNKDTGWAAASISGEVRMYKTLNSGVNWVNQPMPNDASFVDRSMSRFVFLNEDVGYGVGGNRFINSQFKGVIWKTTNSGANWGYQQPDTQIQIGLYTVIDFVDTSNGWAYAGQPGIHTVNGGGPIIYTAINQISSEVPEHFKLYQNYPNPFNPVTNIKFEITSNVKRQTSNVKLIVYDVLGRIITVLVNEKLKAGTYEVEWDAYRQPSGIYFYTLQTESFSQTKKMILVK